MGSYLSLPLFWLSPGLILLSRELLEAKEASVWRLLSLGCPSQAWPGSQSLGLGSVPGDNLEHTLLLAPQGSCGPSMGGMFDRGMHVFSKQTLIHVSQRNVQTDFCRPHPSGERWAL